MHKWVQATLRNLENYLWMHSGLYLAVILHYWVFFWGVSIWETEANPRSFYYSSMWIYKELRITGLVRKISEFGMVYVLHSNKAPCSFWTEPPLAMKHHCLLQEFSFSWFFFLPYSPLSLVSCWLAYLFSSVWLRWLDTRLEFSEQRFEGSESWNHFPTYQLE